MTIAVFENFPAETEFDLIVADPPWSFKSYSKKGYGRAPERHYQTQSLDWICSLPVPAIAAKNSHLMLWINGVSLVAGYHTKVLEAWGFKPSSIAFVWLKNKKGTAAPDFKRVAPITSLDFVLGLGHTTRQNAEFVILGRRGQPKRQSRKVHQVIVEPRREHSRKPELFYEKATEYVGQDARKAELFARTPRDGWSVWGNETSKYEPAIDPSASQRMTGA